MWRWWSKRRNGASLFVFFTLCFVCVSNLQATLVEDVVQPWHTTLYTDDEDGITTITCIAHYITADAGDSVSFSGFLKGEYTGPNPEIYEDQWEVALTPKSVYIFGPAITNSAELSKFFNYTLYFDWNTDDLLDPIYPVYMDTAVFNGPLGDISENEWGYKGDPLDTTTDPDGEWIYREDAYDPGYTNPAPEPMTVLLLGLGGLFLIRTRRSYV